jgi:hypothetical protein
LEQLDQSMGYNERRSAKVIGEQADVEEQHYRRLMDIELLPAEKVFYEAYSHHSSTSSLNSPPLVS